MHGPSTSTPQPHPSLTTRTHHTIPDWPQTWSQLLERLGAGAPADQLKMALKSAASRDGSGALLLALKEAWEGFTSGRSHTPEESLSSWPLSLSFLRSQFIDSWAEQYRAWEATERAKPAQSPEEDWRFRVMRWHQDGSGLDRPRILRLEFPCAVIPQWEEGKTRLVLLPAPGLSPAWLPGILHSDLTPQEIYGDEGVGLTLRQGTAILEVESIRDLMFTPPEKDRIWLLRYAHLQGACWTT